MKFFHLSDLHIGLKLYNRDLTEDQKHIFDQIAASAKEHKPDAIVIAGDIYDKAVPSAEATETFDYLMNALYKAVPNASIMAISGNHDSAPRVNVYRNILAARNIHMIGNPPAGPDEFIEKVVLNDEHGAVNFYLLPFIKPSMVRSIVGDDTNGNLLSYDETVRRMIDRENIDTGARNVFVSHQLYIPTGSSASEMERSDAEIVTVGNIDSVGADVLRVFDYAALGHIHKPMKIDTEVYRYCGTPMACSVSEAGQDKGIVVVDMGPKGQVSTEVIKLVPLRAVRIISDLYENVANMKSNDYVTVELTDNEDLNIFEVQDRIRMNFPNLLEIRRKTNREFRYTNGEGIKTTDPYDLCCNFAEFNDDEKDLLKDIINTVKGAN